MWENNFKQFSWQGLNLWNMQTTYTTQEKKKKQSNGVMGKRHEYTFPQRRYTNDSEAH